MDTLFLLTAARALIARGDIGHLALLAWAGFSSGLCVWALRELVASNRRFDDFVREIARLNQLMGGRS